VCDGSAVTRSTARARRPSAARGRGGRRIGWAWLVLVVSVALGVGLPVWSQARESARFPVTAADLERARTELDGLAVKGRTPKTGYAREEFGPAWADVDRNGCDTRNDVLARDLTEVAFEDGTDDCVVVSGTLVDPFGGDTIAFERGPRSADVQIDHVVPLSDAWQKGAQQWDAGKRQRFANDPANLLAVDGPLNSAKGDGDAATWLPPSTGYRCAYVVRQVRVKAAYGLWVTQAEHDAMDRQLDGCAVVE
jgi:hypothetical protein